MSYNHTYAQIKDILKSSKKMTKEKMLEIAKLAIIETMGSEMPEGTEITWDSKLGDDLMLDSLAMVELVMFLEECFGIEIPDEAAGEIVTVGDCVYPIPAFLIKMSDIVLSARRFTSAAAGDVLAPTIETVGVAA